MNDKWKVSLNLKVLFIVVLIDIVALAAGGISEYYLGWDDYRVASYVLLFGLLWYVDEVYREREK